MIFVDLSDIVDMKHLVKEDSCFNMPIAITSNGSYFGDNDILTKDEVNSNYRTISSVIQGDSQLYSIKKKFLDESLITHPDIKKRMYDVAEQKHEYYETLKNELAKKYKNKVSQEQIYAEREEDQWTFYISSKRQMVKKQSALRKKLNDVQTKVQKEMMEKKNKMLAEQQMNQRKMHGQQLAAALGKDKAADLHINKYSTNFKSLIGRLDDEKL